MPRALSWLGAGLLGLAAAAALVAALPDGVDVASWAAAALHGLASARDFLATLGGILMPFGTRLTDSGAAVPCLLGTTDCWARADSAVPLKLHALLAPVLQPRGFAVAVGAVGLGAFLLGRLTGRAR